MKARYYLKLVIFLFVFWILLSGRFEAKFLIYGVLTSLIASYVCMPLLMLKSADGKNEYFALDFPVWRLVLYCLWIFWQLITSNFALARAIVSPDLAINPRVVRFKVEMDNPMALTVLANSITLTPGTVTMNVTDDGIYEIHALTDDAADGIRAGDMQRRVARLFGQDETFVMLDGADSADNADSGEKGAAADGAGSAEGGMI